MGASGRGRPASLHSVTPSSSGMGPGLRGADPTASWWGSRPSTQAATSDRGSRCSRSTARDPEPRGPRECLVRPDRPAGSRKAHARRCGASVVASGLLLCRPRRSAKAPIPSHPQGWTVADDNALPPAALAVGGFASEAPNPLRRGDTFSQIGASPREPPESSTATRGGRRARARGRSTATGTATRPEHWRIGRDGGARQMPLTSTNRTLLNYGEPIECDWGSRGRSSNPVSPTEHVRGRSRGTGSGPVPSHRPGALTRRSVPVR